MNRQILGLKVLVALAALTASVAASAQQATYDFTAIITSSDFGYVPVGETIRGSYTFNLGNADYTSDGQSDNGVGYNQPWYRAIGGDPTYPETKGPVFSSSITAGAFTFGGTPSLTGGYSRIFGGDYPLTYTASDHEITGTTTTDSLIVLQDASAPPFTLDGLPVLNPTTIGTGAFSFSTSVTGTNGQTRSYGSDFDYSIKSLTLVSAPEIDPASVAGGLTLLIGGLAVLRGRRKVVV
jgi:opacity protein-like surface antigen